MDLTNDFRVGVPVSEAWNVFTDLERIAPFMPGAQLQEVEGAEYRGIVKIKVGPITAQYKGTATFVEQDKAAGKVVVKASGRDTRGQGNATALITATMIPDGDGTKVSVVTDLTITGKVAQFGRGVLADVSGKLIGQFVDALEADLRKGAVSSNGVPAAGHGSAPPASDAPAEPAAGAPIETAASESAPMADTPTSDTPTADPSTEAAASAPAASSGPRKIEAPEAKPVDLLEAAGGSVAKRALPILGGLAALVVVVLWRRRRKAKKKARRALRSVPVLGQLPGHLPDLRGHFSEVKDSFADVKGHLSDVRGHIPDVRGHIPDVKGHLSDVRGHIPDVRGRIPDAFSDLPSWREVASHLPEVPSRGRRT